MERSTRRRITAGALLAFGGLLLFLAVGPFRDASNDPTDRDGQRADGSSVEPPAVVGDRTGASHAVGRTPEDGQDPSAGLGGDGGDLEPGQVVSEEGPVGAQTAIDLTTVALEAPPPGVSLIAPRFSPSGTRLVASTGKGGVRTLWVVDVDHTERGWSQITSPTGGLSEPAWLDDRTIVAVLDGQLVIYELGGEVLPLLAPGDETGKVSRPSASRGGERLAWSSARSNNGGGDLRVLDRSSGVVTDLTASAVREADPAWRGDGQAVVGTVANAVTAWSLDAREPLHQFPRSVAARSPGWWGDALQWQEGDGLVVDLVLAPPQGPPRVIARRALPSIDRPAPVVAGFAWIASLSERGTLWAVRQDGSAVVVDTDAAFASQPDVVERPDGIWLAFTSAEADTHTTRVHVGRVDRARLGPAGDK